MHKYLVRYYYNHHWYGTSINANSWHDAEAICLQHNLQLDGLHIVTVEGILGWLISKIIGV